jgi:hypothetical protein
MDFDGKGNAGWTVVDRNHLIAQFTGLPSAFSTLSSAILCALCVPCG